MYFGMCFHRPWLLSIKSPEHVVQSRLVLTRLLLVLTFLLRDLWRGEVRQRIAPDEMIEPAQIVLHDGAHRLGFRDAVAKAFVD